MEDNVILVTTQANENLKFVGGISGSLLVCMDEFVWVKKGYFLMKQSLLANLLKHRFTKKHSYYTKQKKLESQLTMLW